MSPRALALTALGFVSGWLLAGVLPHGWWVTVLAGGLLAAILVSARRRRPR